MKINGFKVNENRVFLRTSKGGYSHKGYKRKPVGQWNDAPNWTGHKLCDLCGGFFGIDETGYAFGLLPRGTVELCEWRGQKVAFEGKICVSSYRVVATGTKIPRRFFPQFNYNVMYPGDYLREIWGDRWIFFGGEVDQVNGGSVLIVGDTKIGDTNGAEIYVAGRAKVQAGVLSSPRHIYFYDRSELLSGKIRTHVRFKEDSKAHYPVTLCDSGYAEFCDYSTMRIQQRGGFVTVTDNVKIGHSKLMRGHITVPTELRPRIERMLPPGNTMDVVDFPNSPKLLRESS